MESIANYLSNSIKKLWQVLNPGYILNILATDIDEAALNRVKEIIKHRGFIFVEDRENIIRDAIVSEYTRKRKYVISVTVIHTKLKYPEKRLDLRINIVNEYRGSKPAIKADIDELGASLYHELSQFTGKDKLAMHTYRTPIPME